jgi:hypothetical protein
MAGEMRGISIEQLGERLKRVVAFASLELDHLGSGGGGGGGGGEGGEGGEGDNGGHDARLAALAREWMLLYAASSKLAPRVVDMSEAYDLQRRCMVADTTTAEEEDEAFRRRSRRALEAARLTPQQRQAVADAFAFFQQDTRAPLSDWSRAVCQLDATLGGFGGGGGDGGGGGRDEGRDDPGGGGGGESPPPDASLDLLSGAVARALVARSTHFLSVCGVITPRQLLSAMVAVYPRALRPVNLSWAALEAERLGAQLAAAAADDKGGELL